MVEVVTTVENRACADLWLCRARFSPGYPQVCGRCGWGPGAPQAAGPQRRSGAADRAGSRKSPGDPCRGAAPGAGPGTRMSYQTVMKASRTQEDAFSSICFISGDKGRLAAVPALQAWIEGARMIKTFAGLPKAARFPAASACAVIAVACLVAGWRASQASAQKEPTTHGPPAARRGAGQHPTL